MKKILTIILSHKIITSTVIIIIAASSYFGWQKISGEQASAPQYISTSAEIGTITVSVSGTGQVSALNQVEIKPEASGKIVYVGIKKGQEVKAGTLIAQLDASDALKSIRDAEANLETAKLSLEKLTQPTDELDIIKAQNSLSQAQESKLNSETSLTKTYEDGFNTVINTFLDMPTLMAGLDNILFGQDFSSNQDNMYYYVNSAENYDETINDYMKTAHDSYLIARASYNNNFDSYKNTSRYSSDDKIESLIAETYAATKEIAEAVKNIKNFIDFYEDILTQKGKSIHSLVATHQNSLENYTNITSGHISGLLSAKNNINNYKENIINAERTIQEKEGALADLQEGPDPLDIRSQELTIKQKENSLLDARQKLADYYVRAPFNGIIVELDAVLGESVSSGSAIATIITRQKIAEITLNEIDAAKIKIGQKVTLEFDAIENLSITGEVAEIDELGAVSQGVVSYDVKIAFDVQDERIKPGMSLSANIIIESKKGVLTVPASAVKSTGDSSYVEILVDGAPQRKIVTAGITNDTAIEIIEGLSEGDQAITQTINSGSNASSANSNGSRNNTGMPGGGMMFLGR